MTINDVKIIELPKFLDDRGNLSFAENNNQIPFEINRTYWLYDVPGGITRGGHAEKNNEELVIVISGSFEIPATKGVMLSEYTKDMVDLYPADECAIYFKNSKQIIEKYKQVAARPEELKRISINSYNRVLELGGSELDRAKEIIDCYYNLSQNIKF